MSTASSGDPSWRPLIFSLCGWRGESPALCRRGSFCWEDAEGSSGSSRAARGRGAGSVGSEILGAVSRPSVCPLPPPTLPLLPVPSGAQTGIKGSSGQSQTCGPALNSAGLPDAAAQLCSFLLLLSQLQTLCSASPQGSGICKQPGQCCHVCGKHYPDPCFSDGFGFGFRASV